AAPPEISDLFRRPAAHTRGVIIRLREPIGRAGRAQTGRRAHAVLSRLLHPAGPAEVQALLRKVRLLHELRRLLLRQPYVSSTSGAEASSLWTRPQPGRPARLSGHGAARRRPPRPLLLPGDRGDSRA